MGGRYGAEEQRGGGRETTESVCCRLREVAGWSHWVGGGKYQLMMFELSVNYAVVTSFEEMDETTV